MNCEALASSQGSWCTRDEKKACLGLTNAFKPLLYTDVIGLMVLCVAASRDPSVGPYEDL